MLYLTGFCIGKYMRVYPRAENLHALIFSNTPSCRSLNCFGVMDGHHCFIISCIKIFPRAGVWVQGTPRVWRGLCWSTTIALRWARGPKPSHMLSLQRPAWVRSLFTSTQATAGHIQWQLYLYEIIRIYIRVHMSKHVRYVTRQVKSRVSDELNL